MDSKLLGIIDKHVPRKRPDGFGISCSEYAKVKGVSSSFARRILEELVNAGILEKEKMVANRAVCSIYFEATKKK